MSNDIDMVANLLDEITGKQPVYPIESVIVDDKDLLSVIEEFISKSHMRVRIKRGDGKNNILLTSSFYPGRMILVYKDKENSSNVISFYKNTEGNSLFNYSLKHKQIINHPMFEILEERIDLESLYLKAVSSMVMGLSKDDVNFLQLLKEDVKFMNTLSELKEKFKEGYNLLTS
jgi:hypothetical protein